ncbi:hypothetical protein Hanom_Chr17g01584981 [Helianthus anomalus]
MEFKELFGSFTGHRVENRSTEMRYGSIESARNKKRRIGLLRAVGDGCIPVPDGSQKSP